MNACIAFELVEDFLSSVRALSEHKPPIGVFFESENIYSLKESLSAGGQRRAVLPDLQQ